MTGITTKPEHGSVEWRGPPTSFDGFVVDRVLGKGGMGDVYLGRDTTLDRQVALKFISAPEPSPQARGRFLVKARAVAKLCHPNVVAVFSVGEVEGRPYIAYEFVEGQSLERLVKPVPWETALRIAVGLTAGLEAAHREGILHRDIKPSNVVLSERGEVKLLDFGLAKLRGGFDEPPELVSGEGSTVSARAIQKPATRSITEQTRNITKQGTIMGTPAYLAPELWWGEAATTRSDVWALGLVLYDLLFGKLPHADLHGDELTFAIIDRDLPSIRTARPDVPASFADIIERCLTREADERFSSADELAKAMRDVSGEAVFAERDAPTMAKDVAFNSWLALFLRQSASPGTMVALLKRDALLDLTDVLPKLTLPVLVLHRTGDRTVPIAAARDLAAKLPDATFIELEGNDHLAYVADASSVLAEVEGFVGARD